MRLTNFQNNVRCQRGAGTNDISASFRIVIITEFGWHSSTFLNIDSESFFHQSRGNGRRYSHSNRKENKKMDSKCEVWNQRPSGSNRFSLVHFSLPTPIRSLLYGTPATFSAGLAVFSHKFDDSEMKSLITKCSVNKKWLSLGLSKTFLSLGLS